MVNPDKPEIRRATAGDWPAIKTLLLASDLPIEDLVPNNLSNFLIATVGGTTVGVVGVQGDGSVGLLRSLAVAESARGSGLGSLLVRSLESVAGASGIAELWLLTIDAEKFFLKHEFVAVDRELAPEAIRQSDEFSHLCPADAWLMRKLLVS